MRASSLASYFATSRLHAWTACVSDVVRVSCVPCFATASMVYRVCMSGAVRVSCPPCVCRLACGAQDVGTLVVTAMERAAGNTSWIHFHNAWRDMEVRTAQGSFRLVHR